VVNVRERMRNGGMKVGPDGGQRAIRCLRGRLAHDHHARHTLGQEETVAKFQGETRFRPVGIFVYTGPHDDLLCVPVEIQFHGGEHPCKSTQRTILRVRAKNATTAIHGSRLGR